MKPNTKTVNQVISLAPTGFAAFGKGVQFINGLFFAETDHIFRRILPISFAERPFFARILSPHSTRQMIAFFSFNWKK